MSDNKKKELGQELDNVSGGALAKEGKVFQVIDERSGAVLAQTKSKDEAHSLDLQQGYRSKALGSSSGSGGLKDRP